MAEFCTEINTFDKALSTINRNTKRSDLKDNTVALIFFDKFNTTVDNNGKRDEVFDDNEWNAFEKYVKTIQKRKEDVSKIKVNKSAIKHFEKIIEKSEKKLAKISRQTKEIIDNNSFEQFCDLEYKLQTKYKNCILLKSYSDKQEANEAKKRGAIVRDIEAFGRALIIDKDKNYSGTQKETYIEFPPEMTQEEKDEFLALLDKALKEANQIRKLSNAEDKETKKIEKNLGLINSILMGKMKEVGSTDSQNQIFSNWQNGNFIRKRIEELEKQRERIWRKSEPTEADTQMLRQLDDMLKELYNTDYSGVYSFDDNDNETSSNENGSEEAYGLSGSYTETVSYADRDSQTNNHVLTDSHQLNMSYKLPDWKISLNGTKEEQYITKYGSVSSDEQKSPKFQNNYIINPSVNFSRDNWALSLNSNLNIKPSMIFQMHSFTGKYKNTELTVNENINTMKMNTFSENGESEEQVTTNFDTEVELSQQLGKFNISASVDWSDAQSARTYEAGGKYSLSKQSKNNQWNFSLTPSVNLGFIDTWDDSSNKINYKAGLNSMIMFNKGKFSSSLMINDNVSQTFSKDSQSIISNFGMATLTAKYDKLEASAGYLNQYSDSENFSNKTNQGNFSISYNTSAGTIEGSYSIAKTTSSCSSQEAQSHWTNTFACKYTATFNQLKNIFKKKSHKEQ